jgi:hypothetical protein
MIIRGLAGVVIGIAYGALVSALVFLLTRPDLVKPGSGLMIMLDPAALAWFGVWLSGITAGVCAVVVGLIVGIAGMGKSKAATTGFLTGLLVFGLISVTLGSPGLPKTLHQWMEILVTIALLPIGLALTGMVVAILGDKLRRRFSEGI